MEDILVICPTLMKQDTSVFEFLVSAAHEHGHEIYNRNRGTMKVSQSDTGVVFEEFFPFMEAQRLYSSLSEKQRATLGNRRNGFFDPNRPDNLDYVSGQIRGLSTTLKVSVDEFSYALLGSYAHGVESEVWNARASVARPLLEQGIDPQLIKKRVSKIKALSVPVINSIDIDWQGIKNSPGRTND